MLSGGVYQSGRKCLSHCCIEWFSKWHSLQKFLSPQHFHSYWSVFEAWKFCSGDLMHTKTWSLSHYLVLLSLYKCNFQLLMKFSSDNIQCLNKFQDCKETLSKKNILQINLFVLYYIWLFMLIFLNQLTVFLEGVVISHVSHVTFLLIKEHYWFTCMLDMHSSMKQCACFHTSTISQVVSQ